VSTILLFALLTPTCVALLKMAKRIKREESSDVPNQHAARSTGTPLIAKRKLDQDSEDETPVKRGKAE